MIIDPEHAPRPPSEHPSLARESLPPRHANRLSAQSTHLQGSLAQQFSAAVHELPRAFDWISEPAKSEANHLSFWLSTKPLFTVEEVSQQITQICSDRNNKGSAAAEIATLGEWQTLINAACTTDRLEAFCDRVWAALEERRLSLLAIRTELPAVWMEVREQSKVLQATVDEASNSQRLFNSSQHKKLEELQQVLKSIEKTEEISTVMKDLKRLFQRIGQLPTTYKDLDQQRSVAKISDTAQGVTQRILLAALKELRVGLAVHIPPEAYPYDTGRLLLRIDGVSRAVAEWRGQCLSLGPLTEELKRFRSDSRPIYRPIAKQLLRELDETLQVVPLFFRKNHQIAEYDE
jgi:hypothetical protein